MSWYDKMQALAAMLAHTANPEYGAPGALPQSAPLPQATIPAGGPPQRPDSGLYASTQVPLPPQRPQGIVPQAPAPGPQYGNPSVVMPSGLPYEPDQSSIPQTQGLQARQVPLPPQRPTSLTMGAGGMPDISGRQSLPAAGAQSVSAHGPRNFPLPPQRPADLSVPNAQAVQAQAPQGQMHPAGQIYQGADGGWYRDVPGQVQLSPTHGLAAMLGAQPSLQASTSTGPTAFLDQLFGFRTDPSNGQ